MNEKIRQLLDQMSALEDDLRRELQAQEASALYQIKGKRVEFEAAVRQAHRKLKTNFFRWLVTYRPQNLITGPIIYSMIVPMLVLDVCVSFYQATCFRFTASPRCAGVITWCSTASSWPTSTSSRNFIAPTALTATA